MPDNPGLQTRALEAPYWETELDAARIGVAAEGGVVTAEVKAGEVPVSQAMVPENLHRLFAEETARWHPGGYEDDRDGGESRAPSTTRVSGPKPRRAP